MADIRLFFPVPCSRKFERVLHYPRLLKRFALTETEITHFIAFLAATAEIVEIDKTIAPPIRDPKDTHIVQTAVRGEAAYICTLDEHFYETPVVTFCSQRGVTVITDLELLRLVRGPAREDK